MSFNKNKILLLFYFFIIIVYPLVYQLNENDTSSSLNNKLVFFLILFITILTYSKNIFLGKKNIIDYIFIWSIIYLLISLLFYSSTGVMLIGDILREVLYSIVPYLLYFMGRSFTKSEINIFINTVFILFLSVIFVGVVNLFDFNIFKISAFQKGNVFKTFYSAIAMGYIAQFMFALILFDQIKHIKFKKVLLGFFLMISLVTLQRSSYLGISIALLVYAIYQFKGSLIKIIFNLSLISLLLYIVLTYNSINIIGFDFGMYLMEEFYNFNYTSVANDRVDQAIIFNNHNYLNILFGEGFGKYSPNNTLAKVIMPDAAFYRIYNELGVIGGLSFFLPIIYILIRAINNRKAFEIYLIGFTLIAFFFNRIIWMIPLNYIFFTLLGIFANIDHNKSQSRVNKLQKRVTSSQ